MLTASRVDRRRTVVRGATSNSVSATSHAQRMRRAAASGQSPKAPAISAAQPRTPRQRRTVALIMFVASCRPGREPVGRELANRASARAVVISIIVIDIGHALSLVVGTSAIQWIPPVYVRAGCAVSIRRRQALRQVRSSPVTRMCATARLRLRGATMARARPCRRACSRNSALRAVCRWKVNSGLVGNMGDLHPRSSVTLLVEAARGFVRPGCCRPPDCAP